MIQERILDLADYGVATGLIEKADTRLIINRLLELFQLDELEDEIAEKPCEKRRHDKGRGGRRLRKYLKRHARLRV